MLEAIDISYGLLSKGSSDLKYVCSLSSSEKKKENISKCEGKQGVQKYCNTRCDRKQKKTHTHENLVVKQRYKVK